MARAGGWRVPGQPGLHSETLHQNINKIETKQQQQPQQKAQVAMLLHKIDFRYQG
jgi:hypothetical protein